MMMRISRHGFDCACTESKPYLEIQQTRASSDSGLRVFGGSRSETFIIILKTLIVLEKE